MLLFRRASCPQSCPPSLAESEKELASTGIFSSRLLRPSNRRDVDLLSECHRVMPITFGTSRKKLHLECPPLLARGDRIFSRESRVQVQRSVVFNHDQVTREIAANVVRRNNGCRCATLCERPHLAFDPFWPLGGLIDRKALAVRVAGGQALFQDQLRRAIVMSRQ